MKILKKLTALLIASVTAIGGYLSLPIATVANAIPNANGEEVISFNVLGVPTEHKLSDDNSIVALPEGNFPANMIGATRVYNGSGRVVYDSTVNDSFAPKSAGNYTIVYGYMDGENFVRLSGDYNLVVTGEVTTLEITDNNEFFLPSRVPQKDGTVVNIPMPNVIKSDGTVVTPTDNNYPNVQVTVTCKNNTKVFNLDSKDAHKELQINSQDETGIYEVRYVYGNAILLKQFEVVKASAIDTTNLGYTATMASWDESTARYIDTAFALPKVTVKDSSGNDVTKETYTEIKVTYVEIGEDGKSTEKVNSDEYFALNGNNLTAKANATNNGNHYEVTYTVKDYFKNVVKTITFNINNVKDRNQHPTVYLVDTYDVNDTTNLVSIKDQLPTKYNIVENGENVVVIPAMYAEDVYGSEMTYKRTYKTPSSSVLKEFDADYNEKTTLTISEPGEYTITFTATSKLTTKPNTSDKTFKIVAYSTNDKIESTPEFEVPSDIPANVKLTDTVFIAIPSAKDYDKDNNIVDERVTVTASALYGTMTPVYEKYVLTGYNYTPAGKGVDTITFTATNDNKVAVNKDVKITVLAADSKAPTLEIATPYAVDDDKSIVTLPEVSFNDLNNDDEVQDARFTSVYVQVFDPKGNEINDVRGVRFNRTTHTVYGGSFTASLNGNYRIVYTAIDAFNNSSSMMIVTKSVSGTSKYVQFSLKSSFPTSAQPNEFVQLPVPTVILDGEETDVDYEIQVLSDAGIYTLTATNKFSAKTEGEYVFVYTVDGKVISPEYRITVSDTIAPEIHIDTTMIPKTVYDYDEDNPTEIFIPTFNPSDNVKLEDYNITITVDGSEFKKFSKSDIDKYYESHDEVTSFSFTPNQNGVYKVVYSATDMAGNKADSYTIEINVGDTDTPQITLDTTIPTTVDKGYTLSLSNSDIKVTDNSNQITKTVTLKNSSKEIDNTAADAGKYTFKLDEVGEYTLTITVDDGFGHKNKIEKTITVTADTHTTKTNTEVIGIILIVVSLLILGGVVLYFIKTRDKSKKPEITTTEK